jgi:hypothetical protein
MEAAAEVNKTADHRVVNNPLPNRTLIGDKQAFPRP